MSISSALTSLQADITAARSAITTKGGTVTSGGGSSQLATDIATIPTGVTPTGTITITQNGTGIDVAQYATADVNVQGGGATPSFVTVNMPESASWCDVCYGIDKYVAIASNSTKTAYSYDGITWTLSSLPASVNWSKIRYGNGKFVAIAQSTNIAAYSTDGISWTQTTMPSSSVWSGLVFGNGRFLAFIWRSQNGAVSTDGVTWTSQSMGHDRYYADVAYGLEMFLAACVNLPPLRGNKTGTYWDDWNTGGNPSGGGSRAICYGNGKFVQACKNYVAYTTDGINWTSVIKTSGEPRCACYGNGKYIWLDYNTSVGGYSKDGINWSTITLPVTGNWRGICYGNGKFIAVKTGSSQAICCDLNSSIS